MAKRGSVVPKASWRSHTHTERRPGPTGDGRCSGGAGRGVDPTASPGATAARLYRVSWTSLPSVSRPAGRGLLGRLRGRSSAQYESLRKAYCRPWGTTSNGSRRTYSRNARFVTAGLVSLLVVARAERHACRSFRTSVRGMRRLADTEAWFFGGQQGGGVQAEAVHELKGYRREGNGVFCAFAHDPKQLIPRPANEVFGTRVAFEGHVLAAYCRNAGRGDPIEYEMRRSARVEMERAREEARVQSVNERRRRMCHLLSLDGVLPGGGAALRDAEDFVWSRLMSSVVNGLQPSICLDEPRTFAAGEGAAISVITTSRARVSD